MREDRIGIDLGNESIKIVSLKGDVEPYSIKAMEIFYIEEGLSLDDYMYVLKKSIKKFTKENGIKKASLCFSIPINEEHTIEQFISLPLIKKKLLKKSVSYELEDSGLSESLGHYYHQWSIVNSDAKDNKNNILVLGVKRDLINKLSKIGNLKYKIEHVELQPLSLGRMVWGTKAVIDFGQKTTRIFSFKDGFPFLIKTISIGGSDFDQIIYDEYGDISKDELFEIKQRMNLKLENNNEDKNEAFFRASKATNDKAVELIGEIKNYVRSVELQYDLFFQNIQYTGGTSNLMGLSELVRQEMMLDLRSLEISDLAENSELSIGESNLFFFAISTAMHKSKPYYPDLYFSKMAKTQIDYLSILIATICASLLINFTAIDINKKYDKKLEDINRLASQQSTVVFEMENEISRLNQDIETNNDYMNKINAISGQKKWLSDVLYVLSKETPKEAIVEHLQLKNGQLYITGYAQNYSTVGFIAMSLEKHGDLKIDTIQNELDAEVYSEKGSKMTRGFTITLTYSPNERFSNDFEVKEIQNHTNYELTSFEKIEKIKEVVKEIEKITNEEKQKSEEDSEIER